MATMIISDLHVPGDCRDPRSDLTVEARSELLHCLYAWRSADHDVILAGDGLELVQFTLAEIERGQGLLCQAIEDCVTLWVRGNHDGPAHALCGVEVVPYVVWRGTLIMHGDWADPFCYGPWAWLGRAAGRFAAWAERAVHPDADLWLDAAAQRVLRVAGLGRGRYGAPERYRDAALHVLDREADAERVVIGHTHAHRPWTADGRYANAGTWTGRDWQARGRFIEAP